MSKVFMYRKIEEELRRRIEGGRYEEGAVLGSTEELAREFDTSAITINKALRELLEAGLVKRTPRRGSVVTPRDQWKRGPSGRLRTGLVAAIVFDSSSPHLWAHAIKGMEAGLQKAGYNLVIGNDEGDVQKARTYVKDLSEKGIEGFIIVPIGMPGKQDYEEANTELFRDIRSAGIPYVSFHRYLENENACSVVLENYLDAKKLMENFLKSGVRNPICVSHYHDSVVAERENGFRDSLLAAGFERPEGRIFRLHPSGQTARASDSEIQEIREILSKAPDTDGVFAVSAELLLCVVEALRRDKDLAAKDLRFTGFDYDDLLFNDPRVVALVDPPAFELGELAAANLVSAIRSGKTVQARISLRSRMYRKDPASGERITF